MSSVSFNCSATKPHSRSDHLQSGSLKSGYLRSLSSLSVLLIGLGLLTTLSACDSADEAPANFAPACPALGIPGRAADSVQYDGKGLDVGHLVTHTKILDVRGDCREGPQDSRKRPLTRVRISLELLQQYGPGYSQENETALDVPYFVAIIRDGQIIDKKLFKAHFNNPTNATSQKLSTPLRFIDLPTGRDPLVTPYRLEIGLQLTHQGLDYNRSHLPPATFKDHIPSAVEITP